MLPPLPNIDCKESTNPPHPLIFTISNCLREQGVTVNDEDISRLSSLCHEYINKLDHYSVTLPELVTKGHLRSLKEASEEENIA